LPHVAAAVVASAAAVVQMEPAAAAAAVAAAVVAAAVVAAAAAAVLEVEVVVAVQSEHVAAAAAAVCSNYPVDAAGLAVSSARNGENKSLEYPVVVYVAKYVLCLKHDMHNREILVVVVTICLQPT
jgi:hypothetical protein